MNRRQLEYFEAVADHGGFTSAARALFVAQPSLSQSIKSFESELGVVLFHRLPGGVRLTSAGEALLGPARRTLRSFDNAMWSVNAVRTLEGGSIAIVAIPVLAADPLPRYVGRFRAEYPGVLVRIANPPNGDVLELLRSGECEVALTITRIKARDIEVHTVQEDLLYLASPPDWQTLPGGTLSREELENLPFIAVRSTKGLLLRLLADAGVTPNIAVESAHRDAVLPLILEGAGVSLMPVASAMRAAELGATVSIVEPRLTRKVVVAYRKADLSPAAAAFVEVMMGMVGEESAIAEDELFAAGGVGGER